MMNTITKRSLILAPVCLLLSFTVLAQQRVLVHSHNDYRQRVPFYQAYSQQVYSIEADVFVTERGDLLVGHDKEDLTPDADLENMYLLPLVKLFRQNEGSPWKNSDYDLQLMIDMKTPTEPTLTRIVEMVGQYPEVFDPFVNPNAVKVVITGSVPKPENFEKYPPFIFFDGQVALNYTDDQLERIALISEPFFKYARWNGKGTMLHEQKEKVQEIIDKAHSMGKPIRFWASPDGITAWNTQYTMGVDIINTDRVEKCTDFFRNFEDKNYRIEVEIHNAHGMVTTDRLDKTTSGFRGFNREKIQLSERIEIYQPTYRNDGAEKKIKNIIFLIGDGMGLAQINAAETVNKGLTLLNIKNIGLQKSNAKDAYTTDSAAGGSALATGKATNNRYISMTDDGKVNASFTDYAYEKGLACGVITLGNLADATPAAFYGHATERDDTDQLTNYLLDGKLTLLAGGGMNVFNDRKDAKDFLSELEKQYRVTNDHTPIMLPVFAYGPGSRNFSGVYNNTDIFYKMKELLGL